MKTATSREFSKAFKSLTLMDLVTVLVAVPVLSGITVFFLAKEHQASLLSDPLMLAAMVTLIIFGATALTLRFVKFNQIVRLFSSLEERQKAANKKHHQLVTEVRSHYYDVGKIFTHPALNDFDLEPMLSLRKAYKALPVYEYSSMPLDKEMIMDYERKVDEAFKAWRRAQKHALRGISSLSENKIVKVQEAQLLFEQLKNEELDCENKQEIISRLRSSIGEILTVPEKAWEKELK